MDPKEATFQALSQMPDVKYLNKENFKVLLISFVMILENFFKHELCVIKPNNSLNKYVVFYVESIGESKI